jgi:hypothetical protein
LPFFKLALLTVFKGKGRTQTGQSPNPARTLSDRKPKEPCSYGVDANYTARTCYKRQNDEHNDKNPTHKQANLNIQIDEQALILTQSVLQGSVHFVVCIRMRDSWGEYDQQDTATETTTSDTQKETSIKERDEETTEAEDNTKVLSTNLMGSTDENQVKETSSSTCENKTEGESDPGEDYEEWTEDPWHHPRESKDSEQHAESKQEDKGNAENENENLNLTELTSDPEEKESSSAGEHDAHQSSSIEPTWGKWKQKTEKELEQEWKVWNETNQDTTTQVYRHARCQLCDKPASTTNLKSSD